MKEIRKALSRLIARESLSAEEVELALSEIFEDHPPEPLVAGFLVGLAVKGETGPELTGAARAMLRLARPLKLSATPLLDTAGTGGDGARTPNISTAAALVAAAAGVKVAKHGNRAVSGVSGAADALEHHGVRIDLPPEGLERCLQQTGFCFVFAPAYQPLMARWAPLRNQLGVRTLFNLVGPLINPARPAYQLVGVARANLMEPLAQALAALGVARALVVHSLDGLDEISLSAPTLMIEICNGSAINQRTVTASEFGIERRVRPGELAVASAAEAARMMYDALAGASGAAHDVIALNAGAAIYIAGGAESIAQGVERARELMASGAPARLLDQLSKTSQEVAP